MSSAAAKEKSLTQAERTGISDQKMFEATVQLIVEHGPSGTSLKDVGVLAGYSRGLASHRFGNKDRLFSFTLRRVGELWLTQLKHATANHTGINAVEKALDQHYRFCVEAPDHVRTFYTLWFESVNAGSSLRDAIRHIHKRRHQDVANWITADPLISTQIKARAEDIAGQFSASVIGIVYYWLANPDDLEQTERLHTGLKHTMTTLLSEN